MTIKTLDFLPSIFKTTANQKFLNATLDQLVTEPKLKKINGFIGRQFAPTFKTSDNYITEPSASRQNYQLEPCVVATDEDNNVQFFSSYPDLLQQINQYGGIVSNHSRLFGSESYSFAGQFDFDKLVNFSQYYWLPNGPDPVDVYPGNVSDYESMNIVRDTIDSAYKFSGHGTIQNPAITVARGGTYEFNVDQVGSKFWIQTNPGLTGTRNGQPNINTREVLGVTNNGADSGTITFTVPFEDAQDDFINMSTVQTVTYGTELKFIDIDNKNLANIAGGFDGDVTNVHGKYLVFLSNDMADTSWVEQGPIGTGDIIPLVKRTGIWQIQITTVGSVDTVNLGYVQDIPVNNKVFITDGTQFANTEFYKSEVTLLLTRVPLITAPLTTLYYNDSTDQRYYGIINVVDRPTYVIDVDQEIVGKTNYTSPNGVVFTNGLKVRFGQGVTPASYADNSYYVEQVGRAIRLVLVTDLITPEYDTLVPPGPTTPDYITINRSSVDYNAWSRTNRWFHTDVIEKSAVYNGTTLTFDQTTRASRPIIEFDPDLQLFNHGRSTHHNVDILDFTVTDAMNEVEGAPGTYFTDVGITDGMTIVFANDIDTIVRDKIWTVNILTIEVGTTIHLSQVAGGTVSEFTTLTPINGVTVPLAPYTGSDPAQALNPVARRISTVNDIHNLSGLPVDAVPGTNTDTNVGMILGYSFWYNGAIWTNAQSKDTANVAPLFDVIDDNFISLSDQSVYLNSSFVGCKLFSYKEGTGPTDPVLGFPISYRNFSSIGDIEFQNNFDSESFTELVGAATVTHSVNASFIPKITSTGGLSKNNIWVTAAEKTKQYQLISNICDGLTSYFKIDILPADIVVAPTMRVYLNAKKLDPTEYEIVEVGVRTAVKVLATIVKGDKVDIRIYSDSVSEIGYYEIPPNLDINALNQNFLSLTLGQFRNHLTTISENTLDLVGQTPGNSNLRDIEIKNAGGNILQHSASAIYASLFLLNKELSFIDATNLSQKEYSKFKNRFLESFSAVVDAGITDPRLGVDFILNKLNAAKNSQLPWYYSDMVPYDQNQTLTEYTVLDLEQTEYQIDAIFNDAVLGNKAILVYLNNVQLVKGRDYAFNQTRQSIIFYATLAYDDVISIRTYHNTDGCYVPETPTKLGLYPKFTPEQFVDPSYRDATTVIRGHDGSITPIFGDLRDGLLLELEKRIYNNIKAQYNINFFDINNYIPGKFRTTEYTNDEYNQVLSRCFLSWVGSHRVDYSSNLWFESNDPWSWNYKNTFDVINNEPMLGNWHAIYQYFYGTDAPNTRPWESLGFSEQPDWWVATYGPAPYTGGNMVLWQDLEDGIIRGGPTAGTYARYARPGVTGVIPVDALGNLRPPSEFLTVSINPSETSGSFAIGDQGPVEMAWRRSSDFPFAVQQAIALMKPAVYFGMLANTQLYGETAGINQFLLADNNQHLKLQDIKINGDASSGTIARTSGYLNWVGDYITNNGANAVSKIQFYLDSMDVQLGYRAAGFTDKTFMRVLAEQSSPSSTNESFILPNENYKVHLHKSSSISRMVYSGVIVEKTSSGYSVSGYDTKNPYFVIIPSEINSNYHVIEVQGVKATIYHDYQQAKVSVPYGYEFNNTNQLVDFLISYGRYLEYLGFVFEEFNQELLEAMNWELASKEFLTWFTQGWEVGNIIILSPVAGTISAITTDSVVDEISNAPMGSKILDIEFNVINRGKFNVIRDQGNFKLIALPEYTIGLLDLSLVQYEHALIFDNETVFKDIIYKPELGNRQYRLKLIGNKTDDWAGQLNPPGFMFSNSNIELWATGKDYRIGDVVSFKGAIYTALQNIDASGSFNFGYWQLLSNSAFNSGLLPNFSYNARKFEYMYDVDNQIEDQNINAFSNGLIGYRDRSYLSDLSLNATSQVKFYQGYIKEKGTQNAISALSTATFNNLSGNIAVSEEWAFRVGEYGATGSNQFLEIQLSDNTFVEDPIAIQLIDYEEVVPDLGVVGVEYNALYKRPLPYTPDIFKNRTADSIFENDFQTAGYVNLNDVDATIFDMHDYQQLNSLLNLIHSGFRIWAAKDVSRAWNVYRVDESNVRVIEIADQTNGLALMTTELPHEMTEGQFFALRGFDVDVDGFYRVESVADINSVFVTVTDSLAAVLTAAPVLTGAGVTYQLNPLRNLHLSNAANYIPDHGWANTDKVWIDRNSADATWAVYNKSTPWEFDNASITFNEQDLRAGMQLGSSLAVRDDGLIMVSGMPTGVDSLTESQGNGTVRVFIKTTTDAYSPTILLSAPDITVGFGSAVDIAGDVIAVGAPQSNDLAGRVIVYSISPNGEVTFSQVLEYTGTLKEAVYGTEVALSSDAAWLYVGSPGSNSVYAYRRVILPTSTQTITLTSTAPELLSFVPNATESVSVTTHNMVGQIETTLIPNVDYTISGNYITFTTPVIGTTYYLKQTSYYAAVQTIVSPTAALGRTTIQYRSEPVPTVSIPAGPFSTILNTAADPINLTGYFSSDAYSITVTSQWGGIAVVDDNFTVTFTPMENFLGTGSFTYVANGVGGSSRRSAPINITVALTADSVPTITRLYALSSTAADRTPNEIRVFDMTTNTIVDTIALTPGIMQLASDNASRVYALNTTDGTILSIDTVTNLITKVYAGPNSPMATMALSPDGKTLIVEGNPAESNETNVYSTGNLILGPTATVTHGATPENVSFDPTGRYAFFTLAEPGVFDTINSTFTLVPGMHVTDVGFALGNAYVASELDNRIYVVNQETARIVDSVVGDTLDPYYIVMNPDQNWAYSLNAGDDTLCYISVIDLATNLVVNTVSTGLNISNFPQGDLAIPGVFERPAVINHSGTKLYVHGTRSLIGGKAMIEFDTVTHLVNYTEDFSSYFGMPLPTLIPNTPLGSGNVWNSSVAFPYIIEYHAGCGAPTAALSAGGYNYNYLSSSLTFDGISWTDRGSMSTARQFLCCVGSTSAAIAFGGVNISYTALSVTETFNGLTWAAAAALSQARIVHSGAGSATSAVAFGGQTIWGTSSATTSTENYNGTAWSTGGAMPVAQSYAGGAGSGSSALSTGGSGAGGLNQTPVSNTYTYNGTSWTASVAMLSARYAHSSTGAAAAAMVCGGSLVPTPAFTAMTLTATTEEFDGVTWLAGGAMPGVRTGHAAIGASNNAYIWGGNDGQTANVRGMVDAFVYGDFIPGNGGAPTQINLVKVDAWTSKAPMVVAAYAQAGCGQQADAIAIGGYDASRNTSTYDGTSWQSGGLVLTGRAGAASCGTPLALVLFGGDVNTDPLMSSETYNGTTWMVGTNMSVARRSLAGVGVADAAFAIGGFNKNILSSTEQLDVAVWVTASNLTTPRFRHTAVTGVADIWASSLAIGGQGSLGPLDSTEYWNGATWAAWIPMITPRVDSAAVGTDASALVFGGSDTSYLPTTESFDSIAWTSAARMIQSRKSHAGAGSRTTALAFGGLDSTDITVIGTTEAYNVSTINDPLSFDISSIYVNALDSMLYLTYVADYVETTAGGILSYTLADRSIIGTIAAGSTALSKLVEAGEVVYDLGTLVLPDPLEAPAITIMPPDPPPPRDPVTNITLGGSDRFGYSLKTQLDGTSIIIGAPGTEVGSAKKVGQAYLYNRLAEEFIGDGSTTVFELSEVWISSLLPQVFVNNVEIYEGVNVSPMTFSLSSSLSNSSITLSYAPAINDTIRVELNYIGAPTQVFSDSGLLYNSEFGTAVTISDSENEIFVGAPGYSSAVHHGGQAYRFTKKIEADPVAPYALTQTLIHPYRDQYQNFGTELEYSDSLDILLVASKNATSVTVASIDAGTTYFDGKGTIFYDYITNSGSVYLFEELSNCDATDADPTKYGFIQQLYNSKVSPGDNFGSAIAIAQDKILVGSNNDAHGGFSSGNIYYFKNPSFSKGWSVVSEQGPRVDIDQVSKMYLYDRKTQNVITSMDFYDPLKGKILGVAEQDLTYKTAFDPANYNRGTDYSVSIDDSYHWGVNQVGQVWWNLDHIRYIDYEQSTLSYRLKHWGELFPGSAVEVYEWVESTVLPSSYTGGGTPKFGGNEAYVEISSVDPSGIIRSKYYFWVSGKRTYDANLDFRSTSIYNIADLIASPASQDIPYAIIPRENSLSLINSAKYLSADDTILHVDYSLIKNTNLIHNEYELISENAVNTTLPTKIVNKLIDSLTGEDNFNNIVPDHHLKDAERYGISIRPRQTMFVDRSIAAKNLVQFANDTMATVPAAEAFDLTKLYLSDPLPTDTDITVENLTERSYIDVTVWPAGTTVLVKYDSGFDNQWAVYTLSSSKNYILQYTQSYRTTDYWTMIDWYDATYDSTVKPTYTVATEADIALYTLAAGDTIKVNNSGDGKFIVYRVNSDLTKTLVGVQDGTINLLDTLWDYTSTQIGFSNDSFDSIRFDRNPSIEFRNILNALKDDIFIKSLAGKFNELFFTLLNYILTEQRMIDWAFKTSFISIVHKLRKLDQFPSYIKDNQSFYEDYINEIKPYRTKIREYLINYEGLDLSDVGVTDFDLPAYYDADYSTWRSPNGEHARDDVILATNPKYADWYANHTLSVESVVVSNIGANYSYVANPSVTSKPLLEVIGGGLADGSANHATLSVQIDPVTGGIYEVTVLTPGSGYTSTPSIKDNGDGTGFRAYPMMFNSKVRSFSTTLKFDRTTYASQIRVWAPNTLYQAGEIVAFQNKAYSAIDDVPANAEFIPGLYALVPDADLQSAADRVTVFYNPTSTMLPSDMVQLFTGVGYPGVKVDGVTFVENPLVPTDSNISSSYLDSNIGIRPEDINIAGGGYIDSYASHAPEELLPGLIWDTVEIRVFTVDPDALSNTAPFFDANLGYDPTLFAPIGYRLCKPMSAERTIGYDGIPMNQNTFSNDEFVRAPWEFHRISLANTTPLVANLYIGNTSIFVADVTKLPTPDPVAGIPGIIYINGEKITYYAVDLGTNELKQIRRAVGGTGAPAVHYAYTDAFNANTVVFTSNGSIVSDASLGQLMPPGSENIDWYSPDSSLMTSTTEQAAFLRAQPSYVPKLPT